MILSYQESTVEEAQRESQRAVVMPGQSVAKLEKINIKREAIMLNQAYVGHLPLSIYLWRFNLCTHAHLFCLCGASKEILVHLLFECLLLYVERDLL